MTKNISEKDLEKIFSRENRSRHRGALLVSFVTNSVYFLFILILTFFAINLNAFSSKVTYWYKYDFQAEKSSTTETTINAPDLSVGASGEISKVSTVSDTIYTDKEVESLGLAENQIKIPALNVIAPITWRVPNESKQVSTALENGIIQVDGTAMPGEKGNIYMTGHSSNYVWIKSKYNSIFATLNRLVIGDFIYLKFSGQVYEYKVIDQKIVAPDDLSIMSATSESKLTLVTCWPVGTSYKRYVVIADQIFPDPIHNKPTTKNVQFQKLPGAR